MKNKENKRVLIFKISFLIALLASFVIVLIYLFDNNINIIHLFLMISLALIGYLISFAFKKQIKKIFNKKDSKNKEEKEYEDDYFGR